MRANFYKLDRPSQCESYFLIQLRPVNVSSWNCTSFLISITFPHLHRERTTLFAFVSFCRFVASSHRESKFPSNDHRRTFSILRRSTVRDRYPRKRLVYPRLVSNFRRASSKGNAGDQDSRRNADSMEALGGLLSRGHDSAACCCSVRAVAGYCYDTLRQWGVNKIIAYAGVRRTEGLSVWRAEKHARNRRRKR